MWKKKKKTDSPFTIFYLNLYCHWRCTLFNQRSQKQDEFQQRTTPYPEIHHLAWSFYRESYCDPSETICSVCMAPKTKIVVIGASYGPDIWHSCLGEDGCFDKRQVAKHEGWGRLSSLWSLWVDGLAMNLHLSWYIYRCTYNPKAICKW